MSNIIEIWHRNQIEQKIEKKNREKKYSKPNKLINFYIGSLEYCTAKSIQQNNVKLNIAAHTHAHTQYAR